jgi:hypothetical protein
LPIPPVSTLASLGTAGELVLLQLAIMNAPARVERQRILVLRSIFMDSPKLIHALADTGDEAFC